MPTYIKFLNTDLTHNGLTYKVGLNVDHLPFVGSGSCSAGGIYFAELSHWTEWAHMGTNAALVRIPDDAQVYREPCGTKLKADKIEIVTIVAMEGDWVQNLFKDCPDSLLEIVSSRGEAIRFVKDQTPEICMAAVTYYGYSIEYVKEQTLEVCLAAVTQNGHALQFVKEQTPEICMAAVTNGSRKYCASCHGARRTTRTCVKDQTPEICLAAGTQNGMLSDVQ